MLQKKIEFISKYQKELLHPVPIKKLVPNWYKQMKNYHTDSVMSPTVKKCVPFLDSLTSGYAILNVVDIVFKKIKNGEELTFQMNETCPWKEFNIGVESHSAGQISLEMLRENEENFAIKLLNPWIIKTPKNYSCLFTNPFNYSNERKIRILDAIVDTDSYEIPINFPCFLKNPRWEYRCGRSLMINWLPCPLAYPFPKFSGWPGRRPVLALPLPGVLSEILQGSISTPLSHLE